MLCGLQTGNQCCADSRQETYRVGLTPETKLEVLDGLLTGNLHDKMTPDRKLSDRLTADRKLTVLGCLSTGNFQCWLTLCSTGT